MDFDFSKETISTNTGMLIIQGIINADAISVSTSINVNAAGIDIDTATELTSPYNIITTSVVGGGVILPDLYNTQVIIVNNSLNSVKIYASDPVSIFDLKPNTTVTMVTDLGNWHVVNIQVKTPVIGIQSYIQQTDPALDGVPSPYIWYQTDIDGNVIDILKG